MNDELLNVAKTRAQRNDLLSVVEILVLVTLTGINDKIFLFCSKSRFENLFAEQQ
jgi:hypothetical protein